MLFIRPQNPKELFNLQHSHLRNAIECAFGLFKRRFRVLLLATEYPLIVQAQLVPALAVIHNFIRIHDPSDLLNEDDNPPIEEYNYGEGGSGPQDPTEHRNAGTRLRDKLARKMWQDHQSRNHHYP